MGKLFNLKPWLTVADTARHLSLFFDEEEEVTEADVLRLALDGHLKLSVNFVNHTRAKSGEVVGIDDAQRSEFTAETTSMMDNIPYGEKGNPRRYIISAINIDGERFLNLDEEVVSIEGVYDLPMIGAERLDIEHEYQNLTDGPDITLGHLEGVFVERPDGTMCQLVSFFKSSTATTPKKSKLKNPPDCYLPAGKLPDDSVLVVRTDSIREFEQKLKKSETSEKDPDAISESERNTLLKLILGMAAAKYGFNHNANRNTASGDKAGSISVDLESLSLKIDSDTVRKYLQEAADQYSDIIVYPKES